MMNLLIAGAVLALIGWGIVQSQKTKERKDELPEVKAQGVRVVDIDMPFGSMVSFMVKWALASIPALIILSLFGFAVAMMIGIAGR